MLTAHDASHYGLSESPKGGQVGQTGRHSEYTASLHQLPEATHPPGPDDLPGTTETRAFAKARDRSLQGAGATACLRVRPTDSPRVIAPQSSW